MNTRNGLGKIACTILLVTCGLAVFWLVVLRIVAKLHGGEPCPFALAWLVDNPLRRRYMGNVLDRIGIQPGERVLELGPGPGAFTVEAARRADHGGTLIAVDIQPRMIAAVEGGQEGTKASWISIGCEQA
jgi:SAM-dependent methyltransferase